MAARCEWHGQARGDLDFNSAIEPDRAALRNFPPRLLGRSKLWQLRDRAVGHRSRLFRPGENRPRTCVNTSESQPDLATNRTGAGSRHASGQPGLARSASALGHNATAGSIYTSSAIALGNTLECLIGGYLISRWSGGLRTFDSPAGVARFALIAFAATSVSATVGVGSLTLRGTRTAPASGRRG